MVDVLVITTSYPSAAAPVGGAFVREAMRSTRDGARFVVLHLDRTAHTRRISIEHDVDDIATIVRIRFPERPTAVSYVALVVAALVGAAAVHRLRFRPQVLHAHFLTAAIPAALLSLLWRRPLVVSEHWSIFLPEDPAVLPRPLRLAARLALARAAIVLPVSVALEQGLRAHGIAAPMRVIPNAVDTAVFGPPSPRPAANPPRVLTVALFYEAKGVDLLLDAVAQLGADVRVDIVGDGSARAAYEEKARILDLADTVTFHGVLPKDAIAALMREADLYVLPSRFDNNPVALLEALVCGLPCVATDVGGVADAVGGDGVLVRPAAAAIAGGIRDALARIGDYDRSEIAARAASRFGTEAIGAVYAELYEAVARR